MTQDANPSDHPLDDVPLVTVFRSERELPASVVKGALESAGIKAMMTGGALEGGAGVVGSAAVMVEVSVLKTDVERAKQIIADLETGEE